MLTIDTTPNVDYFTRDEIKKIVRSFKEAIANGNESVCVNRSNVTLADCVFLLVLDEQEHHDARR